MFEFLSVLFAVVILILLYNRSKLKLTISRLKSDVLMEKESYKIARDSFSRMKQRYEDLQVEVAVPKKKKQKK